MKATEYIEMRESSPPPVPPRLLSQKNAEDRVSDISVGITLEITTQSFLLTAFICQLNSPQKRGMTSILFTLAILDAAHKLFCYSCV